MKILIWLSLLCYLFLCLCELYTVSWKFFQDVQILSATIYLWYLLLTEFELALLELRVLWNACLIR